MYNTLICFSSMHRLFGFEMQYAKAENVISLLNFDYQFIKFTKVLLKVYY